MKLLNATATEAQKTVTGFQFSGQKIDPDTLGSDEYTLVDLEVDVSGSTSPFQSDSEAMIRTVVQTLKGGGKAGNIMFRVGEFASSLNEVHGFAELRNIDEGDYSLNIGGMTALHEGIVSGFEATQSYAESLLQFHYSTNGIQFIITDGGENASSGELRRVEKVAERLRAVKTSETMESFKVILIGIGEDQHVRGLLENLAKDADFDQFVWCGDATPETLRKIAGFVSASVSSQSAMLGQGGPSQNLPF